MTTGGVLAWVAPAGFPNRSAAAAARAPWRGGVTSGVTLTNGGVAATGSAVAGRDGHLAVALHGRIDNLPSLAAELGVAPDDPLRVIAAAYLRHGDGFGDRLLGDFGLVVLDERRGSLLAVRDWIGARPLFWGRHGEVVAVASEVKQVSVLLDRAQAPDTTALKAFAFRRAPEPTATFVAGVAAVPTNGQVLATPERAQTERRRLRFAPLRLELPEAVAAVRAGLDAAVARRTAGASHLAVQLSGGMDSTSATVTAALAAARKEGPVVRDALTLAFPDAPISDETVAASAVAARWGIPWHPVEVRIADFQADPGALVRRHDGPPFPGAIVQVRLAEAAAAVGADVVLTGQGGDNWLRQYGRELQNAVGRVDLDGIATWGRWHLRGARGGGRKNGLRGAGRGVADLLLGRRVEAAFEEMALPFWGRLTLEMIERENAVHGVRAEFPFLDRELAGLLAGLPPGLRSTPTATKYVMREAMREHLPEEVLARMTWTLLDPVLNRALGRLDFAPLPSLLFMQRDAAAWRAALTRSDPWGPPTVCPPG